MSSHDRQLTEQLRELARQRRTIEAQILDVIAEMDRVDIAKHAGYSRLPAFLGEVMHIPAHKAGRLITQAQHVTQTLTPTGHVMPAPLPSVRQALRAGLVDGEHIEAIAETLKQLPDWVSTQDRELVESTLAETAQSADPYVVRDHAKIFLDRFAQDGHEPNHEAMLAEPVNSFRSQRTRDGGMKFSGQLEREIAEVLQGLLGVLAKPQPIAPGVPDPRPKHQRQGDALSDIIDRAATSDTLPTTGGEKPHLVVFLDLNVMTDAVGTATLESGASLCPSAVRRLACDAHLIPMVLNGDSVPLDVGRANRTVTPGQRTALIARDKGCAYPDCTIPARWADAHHIRHWQDGGPTNLANMVLLCRKHHRILHHSEWQVRINPRDGLPEFTPPRWVDPERKPLRNRLHISRQ